jgi:calpain, invertebrate
VYPGIFHLYRAKGIYVFRFFKDFRWIYVIIDDRIPCVDKQPVFSRCKDLKETWVSLIEKAYAKLHGCYEALISGCIDDALAEMTGFVAEKLDLHDAAGRFPNKALGTKDQFWEYMKLRVQERCLMGCSKSNKNAAVRVESSVIIDEVDTGIKYSHAYGILKAFEIDDKQNPGVKIRLVRVRNPWGWGEWTGAWND